MRIAINTRLLSRDQSGSYAGFIKELCFRIAQQHPTDQFIFIFDQPFDLKLAFPANVTPAVVSTIVNNRFTRRWWFDVKVALALKTYKADVFLSPDGCCSLTTSIPQVLMVNELPFLNRQKPKPTFRLFSKTSSLPKYLGKAKVVVAFSQFLKEQISGKYNIASSKIINVPYAASQLFKPVDFHLKEQVKEKYAEGCEYFVAFAGMHQQSSLLNLLKAFSMFKKRQHTNMKLLVLVDGRKEQDDIFEKLETYKFRNAVKLLKDLPEQEYVQILGGAYAMINMNVVYGFSVALLEAMQCHVPVITSNTGSMLEIEEDVALYFDPGDPPAIADQMKLVFKDENLRTRLITNGKTAAEKYTLDNSARLLWTAIEQAVSK